MAYLRLYDYYKQIQAENLSQIISDTDSLRTSCELAAQEEIESYLKQKFDITDEFRDTVVYDLTTAYKAKSLFYLDGTAWSSATTYALGSIASTGGKVYKSILASPANTNKPPATEPTYWTLLGNQYAFYYGALPKPEFDNNTVYAKGDQVFWKDKTYTCVLPTQETDHAGVLQYGRYANLPVLNIFPDDAKYGLKYWGAGTSYSIAAATLPSDAKFTAGDNRSQQVVMVMIDISLFHLHSRISPRNIPELRVLRYEAAKEWMNKAAKGLITPNMPLIQPEQGRSSRFGSNVKRINDY